MNNKQIFKRILKLIRPHIFLILTSLILAVGNVVSALYIPILTGNAIDEMAGAGKVNFDGIRKILICFAAAFLINALTVWIMTLINNKVTFLVTRDLRKDMFAKIHRLPVSYIDSHGHGDLLSRMVSDVERLSDGILLGFTQLFTGVLTILGTLIFMFRISWAIALVVVVLTPLSLFAASFISTKTYKYFKEQAKLQGGLTSFINETIGSIRVVKAFSAEEREEASFSGINETFAAVNQKAIFFSSLTNPVTRFVNGLVYAGVGIMGAFLGVQGLITVGTLSCFLSYANQYTKPFNEISGVITEFQNALACAGRIFEFLDAEEVRDVEEVAIAEKGANVGEPAHAGGPGNPEEAGVGVMLTGDIEIRDLAFSYDKSKKLLYDLSFHVPAGSHIAIVGPTGCGKTTFINLLMRFYEPDSGEILFDGLPSCSLPRQELRKNIGMVLQDTWLKAGTIAENIAYGRPEASRDEIMEAARLAHAHPFISRLEKGYDTDLAADGGSLSAGQKQLLCIARLMLCLPPILILDEATSSIDTRTEININKAFRTMMEGRTSFIVAHRLSTIRNADLILVMKDGNIIEKGNHEELLSQKGFYYQMLNSR